jgi:trimeric autotransporter adhesin
LLVVLCVSGLSLGQIFTISTFAGGGLPVNLPGTAASIGLTRKVAVDAAGNVFMASIGNVVLRLDAVTGVLTLAAGNGEAGFGGDGGPAVSAQLNDPFGVAVDSAGALYIADWGNARIRRVSNGVITTVAGSGAAGFSGDNGPATSAQLDGPASVAVDSTGNLYIADYFNNRIREVSNGVIATVGGSRNERFQRRQWTRRRRPVGQSVRSRGGFRR